MKGEHTREILLEAGYSSADVERMLSAGIADRVTVLP